MLMTSISISYAGGSGGLPVLMRGLDHERLVLLAGPLGLMHAL